MTDKCLMSLKQNCPLVVTGVSGSGGTVPENDPLDETAILLLLLLADGSEVKGDDPELEDTT